MQRPEPTTPHSRRVAQRTATDAGALLDARRDVVFRVDDDNSDLEDLGA